MTNRSTSDKFLIGIVAGVLLLVVIAFVIVLRRPEPQFQSADSAESVVHNYLLALQLGDYEKAYDYLSPTLAYPGDINEFYDTLRERPWDFSGRDNFSLVIESSEPVGDRSIAVTVRQVYNNNALFAGDSYADQFTMRVEETEDGWKIVSGDRFFSPCWGKVNQCEDERPRNIP